MRHAYKAGVLTVTSADGASEVLPAENIAMADFIQVHAPDTIDSGIEVEVREPGDTDWDTLHEDGSAVTVEGGAITIFPAPNGLELRLNATGAESTDRAYDVYGIEGLR